MAEFGEYTLPQLRELREELQTLASSCPTLRESAQQYLNRLYEEFTESLALVRLFATVPFAFVPEREKTFARHVARTRNVLEELTDDTIVVVLAATRGAKPEWNVPHNSRHRLAVPLVNASFVRTIPLVGRVLGATVQDVPWLKKQQTLILTETSGKMSHFLLVEDARSARTGDGLPMVPDKKFVDENGVRTVLALGGRYLNGTSIAMVLFTREHLTHEHATKFATLVNTRKAATMKAVMAGNIL